MSAGERDMSDTEIWGPCGHNWLDFACYAAAALDDKDEARAVEVQAVACATCSDELGDHLERPANDRQRSRRVVGRVGHRWVVRARLIKRRITVSAAARLR